MSIAPERVTRFICFKDGTAESYGYMVSKEGDLWDGALIAWADEREKKLNTRERGAVEAIQHPHTKQGTPTGVAGQGGHSASRPGSSSVRETSLEAYRALRSSGKLSGQQFAIVEYFLERPERALTRQEIAVHLDIGINAVCGRVAELLAATPPILAERGRKRCSVTSNHVIALELA